MIHNGSTAKAPRSMVSILLPAKNEEAAIGKTLRTLPLETLSAMGFDVETVVLDGQSHDATRKIAAEHGATKILEDRGRGKARALIKARPQIDGDYILMLDADGTYAPDALPRALHALAFGDADVVMGHRRIQDGAMSGCHRIGNALLTQMARILYLRRCPDVCTGLWGFRADALHNLPLQGRGFELEAELFALAARKRLRMSVVPVDYLPRHGQAKLSTQDAWRIAWWLLTTRVRPLDGSAGSRSMSRSTFRKHKETQA